MTNGDRLGGMDLGSFFGSKTANREAEAPHLPSDRKQRAFREFGKLAVLGTFSAQKGAVTSNGDIGKTFSWMENLAVLAAFSGQKRKLIGWYRPMFLSTRWMCVVRGRYVTCTLPAPGTHPARTRHAPGPQGGDGVATGGDGVATGGGDGVAMGWRCGDVTEAMNSNVFSRAFFPTRQPGDELRARGR